MRFYGQHKNPQVDEYLYKTFFQGEEYRNGEGYFIECGAHDGIYDSTSLFFERELKWSGMCIEADPGLVKLLLRNRHSQDVAVLQIALTDQEGSEKDITFMQTMSSGRNPGHGGITIPEERLKNLKKHSTITPIKVPGLSMKDLTDKFHDGKILDLFVLDVEGHEVQVLEGMKGSKTFPHILCVEYPISGLESIKKVCTDLGYKFHSVVHNNAHFVHPSFPRFKELNYAED